MFPDPEPGWLRLGEGMFTVVVGERRWDLRQSSSDLPDVESVDLSDGESCVVKMVLADERLTVSVTGHMIDPSLVAARWLETKEEAEKMLGPPRWEYRIVASRSVDQIQNILNQFGANSWEAGSLDAADSSISFEGFGFQGTNLLALLKRPLQR